MTDNERYYTTKIYLDKLANGMNPVTGEDLPEDTILNDIYLCRAFALAADIIEEVIRNGCRVTPIRDTRDRLPFSITEQQRGKIVMSEAPVAISVISRRVERVLDRDIRPIAPAKMTEWLEAQGLLKTLVDENGKRTRVSTEEGEKLGIVTRKESMRNGEEILKNYYDINAQAFVIANLTEIAAFTDTRIRYGSPEKEKEEPKEAPPESKKKGKAKKTA